MVSRSKRGKCDTRKVDVLWSVPPITYTRSSLMWCLVRLSNSALHAALWKFKVHSSAFLKLLAFQLVLPRNQWTGHRFRILVWESSLTMVNVQLWFIAKTSFHSISEPCFPKWRFQARLSVLQPSRQLIALHMMWGMFFTFRSEGSCAHVLSRQLISWSDS